MAKSNKIDRKRKSKGAFSVMDEFSDDSGQIVFSPNLPPEQVAFIDKQTKAADLPLAEREHTVSNTLANGLKTDSIPLAKREHTNHQTVSKASPKKSQPLAYPLAIPLAEREHTVSNTLAISSFDGLVGKERELVLFIFEKCQLAGSLQSPLISTEELRERLKASSIRVRNLVHRLVTKGFLEVSGLKRGRASHRQFTLTKDLFQTIHLSRTVSNTLANREQSDSKPLAYTLAKALAEAPSSSRDLYSKESTTTQSTSVADDLAMLDVSGLREFGITLETFKRAMQLYPTVSVEAFSDLTFRLTELFKNPKERAKIQNARGFVIKLVEQLAGGITPLDHIETATDRLMREYAQAAREKRAEQQGFEETLLQEAFAKWDQELAEEEKFRAVPLAQSAPAGAPRIAIFREHFREHVWPQTREKFLRGEA